MMEILMGVGPDPAILVGCFIAALSQLAKVYILLENKDEVAKSVWAKMLAGSIAYFSSAYILSALRPEVKYELLLGMAGVVGWLGGDTMEGIGRWIQNRFGIPLGIPDRGKKK